MSTSVCDNQKDFNNAFKEAIHYVNKKDRPKLWVQIVICVIVFLFILWALVLASKQAGGNSDQIIHYVLAFVFSPAYIIGYFLSNMNMKAN